MAVLGRILQGVGWIWVAVGFFGPMLNLPDLNFFPGLILVFVSRILRTQAARRKGAEEQAQEAESTPVPIEPVPPPRPLNTERARTGPPAAKPARNPPKSSGPTEPSVVWPKDEVDESAQREDLMTRILAAGSEVAEEADSTGLDPIELSNDGRPMTSAEMIARARQRWDRKPR